MSYDTQKKGIMKIIYVVGDATLPIKLPAFIPHIVNDVGLWGNGFVVALSKRFGRGPHTPEDMYRTWHKSTMFYKSPFELGEIQSVVLDEIIIVNMIAQHGIRGTKPLDLKALDICLEKLYIATGYCSDKMSKNFTVHMPRIGCGLAGGVWEEIEPIILKYINTDTYVYDFERET